MKGNIFIKRPVMAFSISILILIVGFISLGTLPIEQYPDIAPPTVRVSATYTGASADAVMKSVIQPLEEAINGVENMTYMQSTATNSGSADISIYFKQGTDPDMAAVNVQNRVSKAQGLLPVEVTQIGVTTTKRQTSFLQIGSLYSPNNRYDKTFIANYLDINVVPRIKRVEGVGDVMAMGDTYSMRIWLKPDVMAQYGLVPTDITSALGEQNLESPTGSLGENSTNTFQFTMKYKGRLTDISQFEDIVVRSLPDGNILRVKDVARVELGTQSYAFDSNVDGHPSCTFMVFQVAGSNATEVNAEISKLLSEINEELPEGLEFMTMMSSNDFLFASIHEVVKTLIEAFILVFIVVYIFLQDLRSTLIPAIAIPVALIGTFFVLYIIGFSINLLTLCAMVLAIAIVVDDAIVVVEGVHAKLDQGYKSARLASIDAMNELGGAIVSITLVMMSVFIPVSFMTGTSGTFYRQFGLTMAIAIALSAVNALTLSPALCAILLKPHDPDAKKKSTLASRFHASFNAAYDTVLKKYKKRVLFFIQKPVLTIGSVVVGFALLIFLMKVTPTGLVPNEDTGTIMAVVDMPPGSSLERTQEVMWQVDSLLASDPAIESRTMIAGYSFIAGQGPSYGSFICKMKNWDERSIAQRSDFVSGMLYLKAREVIKDARVLLFAPPMIPGYSVSNGFEMNLQDKTGGSLDKFYEVAQDFITKLQARPEIQSAQTSFNPNFPQYMIDIDAAACKKAGLSPSDILTTLQGYYGGLYSSNFNRFGKMYRVMIQADPNSRTNLESLNSVKVRNGNEMAPITQFMSVKRIYGPDNIKRFNMFTAMTINGSPADGYSSGQAIQAMQEVAEQTLPTGYGYEFSGMTREEQSSSGSTTAMIFVLCFVFVYLLLSAQYESYILPFAVLLSIPFGLAGSFIFAHLMGLANNVLPILGAATNNIYMQIALIMLMGLLAKNAILIVEFALDRRKMGMSITWAAVLGAGARLRPILMTSLAMVVGLLPLMFAMGVGANGNRALGTAAVGGMFIGMICQIFVVPALFVIFQYLQEKVKPIEWEDIDNTDAETEIEQYAK